MKDFLPVQLKVEEITEYGQRLAGLEKQVEEVEAAKKTAMSAFKDEIDDLRGEIKVLSRTINDGFESRSVPIRKEPNYRTKQWEFVRLDTGEIYKTQAMSADDLQAAFPFLNSDRVEGPVEDVPTDEAFRELNEIAEAAGGDLDVSVSMAGERAGVRVPELESAMEQ